MNVIKRSTYKMPENHTNPWRHLTNLSLLLSFITFLNHSHQLQSLNYLYPCLLCKWHPQREKAAKALKKNNQNKWKYESNFKLHNKMANMFTNLIDKPNSRPNQELTCWRKVEWPMIGCQKELAIYGRTNHRSKKWCKKG